MEYKYPHLFRPIKVGRLTLKNRIEAAPVNISNLPISGYPTAENIAIFEGKAKGGAAIVHMGECRIDMKTGISHKLCTVATFIASQSFSSISAPVSG